ncbi:MAG: energy-coupling factor transporter ATPase [Erysipelotrichaceae bacterium]|nr:energy-coupling factor transporter ATPase [Erysipelotrichaceae bacterium]MBQ1483412.1 energy-coupling factor transporter ATPase [Erysipelotrichaceae bacterium]
MPIKFKALSYIYNKDMPYAHKALDHIDLDIREGAITAVIGETGSGKSTLVEHLNALLLPSEGSLEVLDYEIKAGEKQKFLKPLRKDVGLVFQFSEYQLFEETVIKDVAFGPLNFGYAPQEALQRAADALKMVGIKEDHFEVSPLELSGGQKRRVAIAGIIACDPKIIVLDEPTAGLDPKGSKEIIDLFISLNKTQGKTLIIVSHDNEMVYNYCDDTVVLSKGKLVYHGPTDELFADKEKLKEFNMLEPQIVSFRNELIERGFTLSRQARTLEQIAQEIAKQVKR